MSYGSLFSSQKSRDSVFQLNSHNVGFHQHLSRLWLCDFRWTFWNSHDLRLDLTKSFGSGLFRREYWYKRVSWAGTINLTEGVPLQCVGDYALDREAGPQRFGAPLLEVRRHGDPQDCPRCGMNLCQAVSAFWKSDHFLQNNMRTFPTKYISLIHFGCVAGRWTTAAATSKHACSAHIPVME